MHRNQHKKNLWSGLGAKEVKNKFEKYVLKSGSAFVKYLIIWPYRPPPSKSHVWCPNMTNDTSLERSCPLLLESEK